MLRFTQAIISEEMNGRHRENPEHARRTCVCVGPGCDAKKPSSCDEGFFCYLSELL